jgi:diphthamide synthase (EF-2-diphthine--ammonia ligase)
MLHESLTISRSHAIPVEWLKLQAASYGLPVLHCPTTWADYEEKFVSMLLLAKKHFAIEGIVFGDRCFDSNKLWGEKVCALAELEPIHPIWNEDPRILWQDYQALGIEALICSCLPQYKHILGHYLNQSIIDNLADLNADIFGEKGEYHTFVCNNLNIDKFIDRKVEINNYCFITYKTKVSESSSIKITKS